MNKNKDLGQIYTPSYIVNNILDLVGYSTDLNILDKYIIDNSCGNGAFLKEIVKIYCDKYIEKNETTIGLNENLAEHIYGIEVDETAYKECISNLNIITNEYGIKNIKWKIYNKNAIECEFLYNKMDYVVGNPPYIRIHNLKSNIKNLSSFCKDGMTDIYLMFFDIGFKMLNKTGKLSYITPNSFLTSKAGLNFREFIFTNKTLSKLVDFEHTQVFNATTYSIITVFDSLYNSNTFEYYKYNEEIKKPELKTKIYLRDAKINNEIYLGSEKDLKFLKKILLSKKDNIKVKNGLATLSDSIFFKDDDFPFNEYVVDAFKISKEKKQKAFYPYDKNGNPIDLEILLKNNQIKDFLLSNKENLLKRNKVDNENWFLYGRTQGLKDMYKEKIVVNTIIKDIDSIKLNKIDKNTICYSGLYIIDTDFNQIEKIIKSKNFIKYIKLLKKYKANGYYTFSSKDLEKYINFFYK